MIAKTFRECYKTTPSVAKQKANEKIEKFISRLDNVIDVTYKGNCQSFTVIIQQDKYAGIKGNISFTRITKNYIFVSHPMLFKPGFYKTTQYTYIIDDNGIITYTSEKGHRIYKA